MHELTELTAPVDGIVQQVADRSVGSVLREAETLVTLVPDAAIFMSRPMSPSRDVSYLKIGDLVRVKLESYPFQRFGTLTGADRAQPRIPCRSRKNDQSQLVYRAQVRLDESARPWRPGASFSGRGWWPAPRSRPDGTPSRPICWIRCCASTTRSA